MVSNVSFIKFYFKIDSRKSSKLEEEPIVGENPNAGDNVIDFNNNREELMKFLHDKDINQISVDQQPSTNYEIKEEPKVIK